MRRFFSALRRTFGRRRRRNPEGQMTIVEHLNELRYRLVWVMAAVGLAAIAGWYAFNPVIDILLEPARPFLTEEALVFFAPTEAFVLRIKLAVYIGFVIAFPIVLFHFWRFVAPGLRPQEKKYVIPFVVFGMLLFLAGIRFAYFMLPQAMRFLIGPSISGDFVRPLLSAGRFVNFVVLYLLALGLSFEFPLVLMFLTLTRVITPAQMARYRRHVIMGIAVVSAMITPADPYTMIVLGVALYAMYEACIWLSRLMRR